MPNRAVVFVSEASPYLSAGRLVELMADAERFNRQAGVTGVTLYDGARFLSYMEGAPDGLRVAYARASEARSHLNLIELARGRVSQRRLPRWPMRLFEANESQLQSIAMAGWAGFAQRGDAEAMNATAMDLLVRFTGGPAASVYVGPLSRPLSKGGAN
ncbi:TPA: BLUF domain-containing protein [Stenotrophomonas maltophilia]|nr:BLUF domain-containing protein [Stenotrophomonas maltophilia]